MDHKVDIVLDDGSKLKTVGRAETGRSWKRRSNSIENGNKERPNHGSNHDSLDIERDHTERNLSSLRSMRWQSLHKYQTSRNNVFSIADFSREVQTSFAFHPEKLKVCCCEPSTKDVISFIQFMTIMVLIGMYLGYELYQYYDTKTNRKDYTIEENVDSMPVPFIYIDFRYNDTGLSNESTTETGDTGDTGDTSSVFERENEACSLMILYQNHAWKNYTVVTNHHVNISNISGEEWSEVLDSVPKDEPLLLINGFGGSSQHLLILSDDSTLEAATKDWLELRVVCIDHDIPMYDQIWYVMDHKDQLYKFDNATSVFQNYYWKSDYVYKDYSIKFSYEWFSYDNKVDKDVINYDYFIDTVESTYQIRDQNHDYHIACILQVTPNSAGKRTVFVTAASLDFWQIFSLTGGMFSTLNATITLFSIYLIWGFDFKIISFAGFAKNADPSALEKRKMNAYMSRFVQQSVADELAMRDEEISKLKKTNKKLLKYFGLYISTKKNKRPRNWSISSNTNEAGTGGGGITKIENYKSNHGIEHLVNQSFKLSVLNEADQKASSIENSDYDAEHSIEHNRIDGETNETNETNEDKGEDSHNGETVTTIKLKPSATEHSFCSTNYTEAEQEKAMQMLSASLHDISDSSDEDDNGNHRHNKNEQGNENQERNENANANENENANENGNGNGNENNDE